MNRQLVVSDGRGTRDVLLVGSIAVGRDPSCEISADDPLLSRRHAEFRVTGEGVVLTDLESRNGLRVNGVAAKRAVLRNGDQVQIAGLLIQLVDKSAPSTTVRSSSSVAPSASSPDDEGTVVLFSPPSSESATGGSGTRPAAPPVDEGPRVLPAGGGREARPGTEPPPVRTQSPPRPARRSQPQAEEHRAVARSARTSWVGRIYVLVVGLGAFTAILVAVVMSLWQVQTVNGLGVARATALVHWLAADASAALARGSVAASADAVARERGVVSALVLGLDGRVLAPASRAGETFSTLPAIDMPPSELYVLKSGRSGGLVHVARPIANAGNVRQAVALVTFRPTAGADGGSVVVLLGPAFLIVLTVALVVAASIRRTTLRGLALFNEDIELAIGGQLDAVKDPLGMKPIRDLADTVNYLIARTRAGGAVSSPAGSPHRGAAAQPPAVSPGSRPAPVSQPRAEPPPRPSVPPPAAAAFEARIVADSRFRVIEASPECQQLLGATPKQMIGEHLVQALQSKPLAEAVLTCLGSLPPSGELRSTVRRDAGGAPLDVLVSRAGKDQPVVITIRPGESRVHA